MNELLLVLIIVGVVTIILTILTPGPTARRLRAMATMERNGLCVWSQDAMVGRNEMTFRVREWREDDSAVLVDGTVVPIDQVELNCEGKAYWVRQ